MANRKWKVSVVTKSCGKITVAAVNGYETHFVGFGWEMHEKDALRWNARKLRKQVRRTQAWCDRRNVLPDLSEFIRNIVRDELDKIEREKAEKARRTEEGRR